MVVLIVWQNGLELNSSRTTRMIHNDVAVLSTTTWVRRLAEVTS